MLKVEEVLYMGDSVFLNIYGDTIDFVKIKIDIDREEVCYNDIIWKCDSRFILSVVNRVLDVTKNWKNSEMIDISEIGKVEVILNLDGVRKSYVFKGKVPRNFSTLSEVIDLIRRGVGVSG